MAIDTISCPYCNTQVSLTSLKAERIPLCPRCGELIPLRTTGAGEEAIRPRPVALPEGQSLATDSFNQNGRPRQSNRTVAVAVLIVMFIMGTGAVVFALLTQKFRREQDTAPAATAPEAAVIPPISPAKLPGLGYLPQATDVVIAIQVAETLATPAGRDFLTRSSLATGQGSPGQIESWTGLKLEDFKYFLLGLNLTEPTPKLTVVAETIPPITETGVRKALRSSPLPEVGLRCPTDHTLIITLNPDDLKALPPNPNPEPELTPALTLALRERVAKGAPVWAVGQINDWEKPLLHLLVASLAPERQQILVGVRKFAVSVQFTGEATLLGSFDCTTEQVANRLGTTLEDLFQEDTQFTKAQVGTQVTIQARGKVEAILKAIHRGGEEKGKPAP